MVLVLPSYIDLISSLVAFFKQPEIFPSTQGAVDTSPSSHCRVTEDYADNAAPPHINGQSDGWGVPRKRTLRVAPKFSLFSLVKPLGV